MGEYHEDRTDRKSWTFTLRKLKEPYNDIEAYEKVFTSWSKKGVIIEEVHREDNKQNYGIHYHGIVSIPKALYRKRLSPANYHLHMVELGHHDQRWIDYIRKDQPQPILTEDGIIYRKDDESHFL